jgi:hypothetical protein
MKAPPSLFRELLTGPKTRAELSLAFGLNQPAFSRLFNSAAKTESVCAFGAGPATIYGAVRSIENLGSKFPLFKIDESGDCHSLGELTAIENRGFALEPPAGKPQIFPGIPFYLSDARPQGYLGRGFALRHSDLGFPTRIPDWSEDQIFSAIALRGEHLPGNLLIGNESFARFQNEKSPTPIPLKKRAAEYERHREHSLEGTLPGSSAAGEQPKFSAFLEGEHHVLVKFSPPLDTPKGRRWGDLLIAEFHALETVANELKIPVAKNDLIFGQNRIFLESKRFDRIGARGRVGCVSFAGIEMEWIGSPSVWANSAKALLGLKRISAEDARRIQLLDAFGAWIANSDRHYGNLSFYFEPSDKRARLAPVYDMLPMFFAPKDTEEAEFKREWTPPVQTPETLAVWKTAREAALHFWKKVHQDSRISAGFKAEIEMVISRIERSA